MDLAFVHFEHYGLAVGNDAVDRIAVRGDYREFRYRVPAVAATADIAAKNDSAPTTVAAVNKPWWSEMTTPVPSSSIRQGR
jgi:hypothetical protein